MKMRIVAIFTMFLGFKRIRCEENDLKDELIGTIPEFEHPEAKSSKKNTNHVVDDLNVYENFKAIPKYSCGTQPSSLFENFKLISVDDDKEEPGRINIKVLIRKSFNEEDSMVKSDPLNAKDAGVEDAETDGVQSDIDIRDYEGASELFERLCSLREFLLRKTHLKMQIQKSKNSQKVKNRSE